MSDEQQKQSGANEDQAAFIEELYEKTKKSHSNSITISAVLCVVVLGYMWFITSKTKELVTQDTIRSYVVTWADEQIQTRGPELAKGIRDDLPRYIQDEVPKLITSTIPEYRQAFQGQAEAQLDAVLDDLKPKFKDAVGTMIDAHQAELKAYIDTVKDLQAVKDDEQEKARLKAKLEGSIRLLTDALIDDLYKIAENREFGDPGIDEVYKSTYERLERVNNDLSELAVTKDENMDSEDLDLRYAIAVMLDKLEWSTPTHQPGELQKPAPAPEKN
ncbi:MAG: hypothetical protein CMO74_11270 [Verrucomicrobiales bacterium]|nr:hypothetical protein [Verrucomicrobiales bacterium]|tara:strand:+ start:1437 stop:2258 length:822 start_codon:yes stop_codon:yes gene_type:complete